MLQYSVHAPQTMSKLDIRIYKLSKLISNGVCSIVCSIYVVGGLYHKIHEFKLKLDIIRYL